RRVARHRVCPRQLQMGKRSQRKVDGRAAMIDYLLKLRLSLSSLFGLEIRDSANISRIQGPKLQWRRYPELVRGCRLQQVDGFGCASSVELYLRFDSRRPVRLNKSIERSSLLDLIY